MVDRTATADALLAKGARAILDEIRSAPAGTDS